MKSIEITIQPDGNSTVETKGFAGAACQGASRFLEQALGARIHEQRTPEFYEAQTQSLNLQERSL